MIAFCLPLFLSAQEDSKTYRMVELSYMKAKVGMEAKFEAGVKAHNEKYHKDGKYGSELYAVSTGNEAGWYVWTMGGFTFTDLDSRPDDKAHNDDWSKNVGPYVEDYGRVEYWRWNDMLSNRKDADDETMIQLWWLDIKRGEYYRYKKVMTDVIAVYKKMDEELNSYDNEFRQDDGRDVALVWPLANWASMDKDDWKMKTEFEALHGEGSWQRTLEEWEDVIEGNNQELWRLVK